MVWKNELFTFNPFSGNCENVTDTHHFLDLFLDKLADMFGRVIKIAQYAEIPRTGIDESGQFFGIEVEFIREICKRHNASFEFFRASGIKKFTELVLNETDMTLNSFVPIPNLDRLYLNEQSDLCVMVPKSTKRPVYHVLTSPLDGIVWIVIFILFELIMILLYLAGRKYNRTKGLISIHFILIQAMLSIPSSCKFRGVENMLMIFYLFFAMQLTIHYQTIMTSLMAEISFFPDIDTLQELDASGIPVRYTNYNGFHADSTKLSNLVEYKGHVAAAFLARNYSVTEAYIIPCDFGRYIMTHHIQSRDGQQRMHLMKEHLMINSDIKSYFLRPNSPLRKLLTDYIQLFYQANLHHYWSIFSPINVNKGKLHLISNEHKPIKQDTEVLMFVLIYGFSLSTFVFIAEVLYGKMSRTQVRQVRLVIFRVFKIISALFVYTGKLVLCVLLRFLGISKYLRRKIFRQ